MKQDWMTLKDVAEVMGITPGSAGEARRAHPDKEPWVWAVRGNKALQYPRRRVEAWFREIQGNHKEDT